MHLLHRLPPIDICNSIAGTFLPCGEAGADQCYWNSNSSDVFTIKSAYEQINSDQWSPKNTKWNYAWNFPGPQRIKTFLWLVLHNALLTNN